MSRCYKILLMLTFAERLEKRFAVGGMRAFDTLPGNAVESAVVAGLLVAAVVDVIVADDIGTRYAVPEKPALTWSDGLLVPHAVKGSTPHWKPADVVHHSPSPQVPPQCQEPADENEVYLLLD